MALLWLPEAQADIQRLFDFLIEKNPNAAERMVACIRDGTSHLEAHPKAGRPMADDTGRRELFLPFGAGQYVLRYRLAGGDAVVIRVWHCRERR